MKTDIQASEAFHTRDQSTTVAIQDALIGRGSLGQIAFGLFRAQKRSTVAKSYRRGSHRKDSYDRKNAALAYVDAALHLWADRHEIEWGWKVDSKQSHYNQVLYVDVTPTKQCSFHSHSAVSEKRYPGEWKRSPGSEPVVIQLCQKVLDSVECVELTPSDLMPFGKLVGKPLSEIDANYSQYLLGWSGISGWPSLHRYLLQSSESFKSNIR